MSRNFPRDSRPRTQRLRVGDFELAKVGVQRFDLRDPYHFALTVSWPWFIVWVFVWYGLINIIFASLYLVNPGSVSNVRPGSLSDAFFFSIETLATVGYGEMAPANTTGHVIASAEIVIGMAFTAIMTGLVFVRFSKPRAKIFYADKAVLTAHNGAPTLMVRIGNGRVNPLTNVQVQLYALVRETSSEGVSAYNLRELSLAWNRAPSFPLLLTLMHTVNDASPLRGLDNAEALAGSQVRLFVSVEARDPALAATVQDLRTYGPEQIAIGMRYVDAVALDAGGRPLADMTKISMIEPAPYRPATASTHLAKGQPLERDLRETPVSREGEGGAEGVG
jgi:inward rectifier potassium channel